ncbi:angiopoietin-1-like [Anopheles ziemanni]|uniref:angiopoietin-1-like n=1 Tax=Anopheles coustani TaxID=139045 RepID=UPI00265A9659|nr:angiopoietin-1-like [Anopheles coustani]XP_058177059.1 angiopoietin-1-like [Anopheles ziemanni]
MKDQQRVQDSGKNETIIFFYPIAYYSRFDELELGRMTQCLKKEVYQEGVVYTAKLDFLQEKLQEIEHNLLDTMDRKLDHLRNKFDEMQLSMKARDGKLDVVEHALKEVGSNKVCDLEESMKTRDDLWQEIARGVNTTHTNLSFQLEDQLTTLEDKLTTKLNDQHAEITKLQSETRKLLDVQAEYGENQTIQMEHIANSTAIHSCLKLGDLESKLTAKLSDLEGKQQAVFKKLQDETKKLFELQTEYIKNLTTQTEAPGICKNASTSGVYLIQLNPHEKVSVYCEQGAFGGGWIVMQHRYNGQLIQSVESQDMQYTTNTKLIPTVNH